jgi:hypothetical protein
LDVARFGGVKQRSEHRVILWPLKVTPKLDGGDPPAWRLAAVGCYRNEAIEHTEECGRIARIHSVNQRDELQFPPTEAFRQSAQNRGRDLWP